MSRVAIIGAGIAGLACARALAGHGVATAVFDKGRAPGGRMATRRLGSDTFDLGAQYFTARDPRFVDEVRAWVEAGVCAPWQCRVVAIEDDGSISETAPQERFVGTPTMSAVARHLAFGVDVRASQRIDRIGPDLVLRGTVAQAGNTLAPAGEDDGAVELGRFDAVVVCLPSEQAVTLLDGVCSLVDRARAVPMEPCFALGVSDDALRSVPFDGGFVGREGRPGSALSWIARDSSKPGRPPGERWVVHASAAWSRAHLESAPDVVTHALLADLARVLDRPPLAPSTTTLQRWAHARATPPLESGTLFDEARRIGIAGDWTHGGRVEGAYVSGVELAKRVVAAL